MAQRNTITPQRRAEIFAKEVLTTSDIAELCCVKTTKASEIIRVVKSKNDRLDIAGVIHIQDYIDFYHLDISRYVFLKKERLYEISQ